MDTLHDRLAELADDAPTGGAPAAELWARGKRTHRLRVAGLAATLLVIGAVGTGVGVRLVDGDGKGSDSAPATNVGFALPIEYPVGEELPDLGETPGPLAAVWLAPREGGGAPDFVGLVAETGRFGTIPIELPDSAYGVDNPEPDYWPNFELSPDGRRIAYHLAPGEGLVVRDLVSGEKYSWDYELRVRSLIGWVDADHLFGHVTPGGSAEGYLWKPGTAPERVDWYSVSYGDSGLSVPMNGNGPRSCSFKTVLQDVEFREMNGGGWAGSFEVPVLCDVEGVTNSGMVLGHWKDQRDGNGTVVALDVDGAGPPLGTDRLPADPGAAVFDDPALRHLVVTAGAPDRVTFATNLIEEALDADGGAS